LYAKARAGEILNFTGISAPFEMPLSPALDVPTHELNIEDAADMVVQHTIELIALNHE
jgi:adenylylsulfate kinase